MIWPSFELSVKIVFYRRCSYKLQQNSKIVDAHNLTKMVSIGGWSAFISPSFVLGKVVGEYSRGGGRHPDGRPSAFSGIHRPLSPSAVATRFSGRSPPRDDGVCKSTRWLEECGSFGESTAFVYRIIHRSWRQNNNNITNVLKQFG